MRSLWRGAAPMAALAVLTLPFFGCDNKPSGNAPGVVALNAGDTVAIVNGQSITQSQFFTQLQNYTPNPQGQTASLPTGRAVMQQLIGSLCVIGLAEQQGVAPTDAEIDAQYSNLKMVQDAANIQPFEDRLAQNGLTTQDIKDLQIRPELAQIKLLAKGATAPTDAQVKAFYDQHKVDQFTKPARAHIKVIALADQTDAQQIYQQIQGGQKFDTFLPRSLNKSFVNGEFPQWVPLDAAKNPGFAPVINSIQALNSGQVTKPFAFGGGWWLAEVLEKKPLEVVSFDSVKGLIPFILQQQSAFPQASDSPAVQQQKQQKVQQVQQSEREFQTKLAVANDIKINLPGQQYTQLLNELKNPPTAAPAGLSPPPQTPSAPH